MTFLCHADDWMPSRQKSGVVHLDYHDLLSSNCSKKNPPKMLLSAVSHPCVTESLHRKIALLNKSPRARYTSQKAAHRESLY